MNCQRFRQKALDQMRCGHSGFDIHFKTCAKCRRFLETQLAIQPILGQISHEILTGRKFEASALFELGAVSKRREAGVRRMPGTWATSIALAVFAILAVFVYYRPVSAPPVVQQQFVEIPYIAPLAPYEQTRVVRMELPVAALIAAGFDVHSTDAGLTLKADVLFGQDGRAHAVRLLTKSTPFQN